MHLAYHLASACSLLQTSICVFVRVQTSSPFKVRRWEIEDRCVFYKLLLLVLILSFFLCVSSLSFAADFTPASLHLEISQLCGAFEHSYESKPDGFSGATITIKHVIFHSTTKLREKRGESQNPLLKWRQSVARRVGKLCWLFEKVSSVLAPSGPVLFRCTTTPSHAVCISSESSSFIIFFLPATYPQKSWNWIIVSSQQNNSGKKRKTFATSEGGETRRTQQQKIRK